MNIDIRSEEWLEGYCYALSTIVWPADDGKWVQDPIFTLTTGYEGIVYFFQDVDEDESSTD